MASGEASCLQSVLSTVCDGDRFLSAHTPRCNTDRYKEADSFIKWASGQPHVKVTEFEVPGGILPEGESAMLADIKVSSRGPDDKIYDGNKEIRDKVSGIKSM